MRVLPLILSIPVMEEGESRKGRAERGSRFIKMNFTDSTLGTDWRLMNSSFQLMINFSIN